VIPNEPSSLPVAASDNPLAPIEPTPTDRSLQPVGPNSPPWGIVWGFSTWVVSVLCLLFVPIIVVLPYMVYVYATSGPPTGDSLMANKTFLFLSIMGVIPAHLITFAVVWAVVTHWRRYPFWATIGFSWPSTRSSWTWFGLCAGIAVLLLGVGSLVTNYFGGEKTQLDQLIESSIQARVATAFLAVATGPLIEELVYRGVLYPAIARVLGVGAAITIVSLLFAGVHFYQYKNNLAVIAVIALLSVVLTVVRAVTGKLLPSFVIHFVFNGLQSVLLLLQPFLDKGEKIAPAPPVGDLLVQLFRHLM
jgi:membrane protease YdiL (CAAX protease family)